MNILYCRIGYMNNYKGITDDSIINGGAYNINNVGHEIYNFDSYNGTYYGFVQAKGNTINLERIDDAYEKSDFIDDVLVIWVATKPNGGQCIVGWYKNARVYRKMQYLTEDMIKDRVASEGSDYNEYLIASKDVVLITPNRRSEYISGIGESNVWYGNEMQNIKTLKYIDEFENEKTKFINSISDITQDIKGEEKESIIKIRLNQTYYRKMMLRKYDCKCCICNMNNKELLIASHIKPWSVSNPNEKVSEFNGLLLCPNHDSLFDKGYISFDTQGSILISNRLSEMDRMLLNVNENQKITIDKECNSFMEYHRKNIFKT